LVDITDDLKEKYPFLSLVAYGNQEYVGVIQNYDDTVLSIYDISKCKTTDTREHFLNMAEVWWWESNRQIPINLFLRADWAPFQFTMVSLNIKDCEIKFGPSVSIKDLSKRRSKRRNIQLVKRVK
jgi:hypothetical protein